MALDKHDFSHFLGNGLMDISNTEETHKPYGVKEPMFVDGLYGDINTPLPKPRKVKTEKKAPAKRKTTRKAKQPAAKRAKTSASAAIEVSEDAASTTNNTGDSIEDSYALDKIVQKRMVKAILQSVMNLIEDL